MIDQDPGSHLPEFYGKNDGHHDFPEYVIFFRGERRTLGSLNQAELRCALMDAHNDLLQAGRSLTRIEVIAECRYEKDEPRPSPEVMERKLSDVTKEAIRGNKTGWRHQCTQ